MISLRQRGRWLGYAFACLAAVLLTACSGSGGSGQAAQDAGPGFPVTVKHAMGETTIPKRPQRVVVLDTPEMDAVTLLGIEPVGAAVVDPATGQFPAYLKDKMARTEKVGSLDEPSVEKIAALKPDLILSSKVRHEQIYAQLSKIAPTVFAETPGAPWKDNLKLYAKALGKEQEAAQALARYQERARELGEAIKAKHGGQAPTVSVVRFVDGPTRFYQKKNFSGTVLSDVGVRRPPLQDKDDFSLDVGPELADQADADYVFVMAYGDPSKTQKQAFQASPLWQRMNAVKNNRVFEVEDEVWMLGIGVQGAHLILDDLARAAGVDPRR
ncbi:ABC-type transporter [Carbonactinospora thermoautotrophica]|uniref:ABC-type transporter n=1 Tax=Carbonactinospora thermoautotrophica TaxID=1469144 RepID=A0A132MVC5_9ACTN|nr:iron-siderophore ABC transporter substrate-binding protein [Carbonactinospora thermoautotrophica]KWX01855.1 ABC-type transporter [Carbonactinospora thermoautotrophica]